MGVGFRVQILTEGMRTAHKNQINADLLAFTKS